MTIDNTNTARQAQLCGKSYASTQYKHQSGQYEQFKTYKNNWHSKISVANLRRDTVDRGPTRIHIKFSLCVGLGLFVMVNDAQLL